MKVFLTSLFIFVIVALNAQVYVGLGKSIGKYKYEFEPDYYFGEINSLNSLAFISGLINIRIHKNFQLCSEVDFYDKEFEIDAGYLRQPDYLSRTDTFLTKNLGFHILPEFHTGGNLKFHLGAGPRIEYVYKAHLNGFSKWNGWSGGGEFNPGSSSYSEDAMDRIKALGIGIIARAGVSYELFNRFNLYISISRYKRFNGYMITSQYQVYSTENYLSFGTTFKITD